MQFDPQLQPQRLSCLVFRLLAIAFWVTGIVGFTLIFMAGAIFDSGFILIGLGIFCLGLVIWKLAPRI